MSPFSGIYRVIKVISKFEGGTFKQELQCIRMQAQPTDFDGKKLTTSTQNNTTVKVKGESKDKNTVSEEISVADDGGTITVGPIPPGEGYDLPGDGGDYGPQ